MFFVRSQVRHTGFELTQADDAWLLAPQMTRFQNTQPLAYNPRRSPAQFSYQNWAGLLRGLYARGCVFWKRVICGARSQASSAWVSSGPVCQTWDRTKNICGILGDEAGPARFRFHRCAVGPQ